MSKISDMYEQIKLQQYTLIKTKLQEAVMARKENRELSKEEKEDYTFTDDEVTILIKMLEEQGFTEGKDFINFFQSDYDSPDYSVFVIKIDGDYIGLSTNTWGGNDIPNITNIESIREMIDGFEDVELEADISKIVNLTDINLEQIQIGTQSKEDRVREKLKESIKDMMTGKEQSRDNSLYRNNEIYVLLDMLKKSGLEEGKDFSFEEEPFEYNETVPELYIRIGDNIIHFSGMSSITEIMSAQELEEDVQDDPEYYLAKLLKLKPLELERLGISKDSIEMPEKTIRDNYDIVTLGEDVQKQKDTRKSFEESLLRDDVVEYYLSKTPAELEAELGQEVAKMVGFEQKNSHHCYDLWEHTLRTVEGIKSDGLTPEQFKKLRIAAFFHDIGKPDVAKFNEQTGQQVFYGHAMHSVDVASPILEKLGYNEQEIAQLGFYIGHHDDFISYKSKLAPFMKNHEFIRGIDSSTIAEKVIENKFDFEAMGYDKDQIRAICYTLAHGKTPDFRVKNQPMVIDVNMEEVQSRMDSGEYDASYDASLEDYQLLLQLCKADASAQSEVAIQKGKVVGSKAEKLENMGNIEASLPEGYRIATEKSRSEFLANILRYATRKVEVRDQNIQAAKLAQDYEQQLPTSQQSLDD